MAGRHPSSRPRKIFYMSDDEIAASYRQAKDPIGQIKVLAELNAVEEWVMRQHLIDIGAIKLNNSKSDRSRAKHINHVYGSNS